MLPGGVRIPVRHRHFADIVVPRPELDAIESARG